MGWNEWAAVVLAVVLGGWLTFDGTRAFVTGDYITPTTGANAGRLGPWSKVVAAAGFDPRSPVVKGIHVGLGCLWLAAAGCLAARQPWAPGLMAACAVVSLWYLPTGLLIGLAVLAALFLPALWRGKVV